MSHISRSRARFRPVTSSGRLEVLEDRCVPARMGLGSAATFAAVAAETPAYDTTGVLVQLRDGAADRFGRALESLGFGWYRMPLAGGESVTSALKSLAAHPDVIAA